MFGEQECFQDKDYLNQRYFIKRAFYLAHIAITLRKSDFIENTSYSYHHGNRMKPVLLLKPAGTLYNLLHLDLCCLFFHIEICFGPLLPLVKMATVFF